MLPLVPSVCFGSCAGAEHAAIDDQMDRLFTQDQDAVLETSPYSPLLPYAGSPAEVSRGEPSEMSLSMNPPPLKRRRLRGKQPSWTSSDDVHGAEQAFLGDADVPEDFTETIFSKRPGRLTLSPNDKFCLRNLLRRCVWRDLYDDTDMCRRGPEEKKRLVYKKVR